MLGRLPHIVTSATLLAACLAATTVAPATAQPAADVSQDRAVAERAAARLEEARARAAAVDARVREASAELDRIMAERHAARERLADRARLMYRSGDVTFLGVLLGADDFRDFAARWEFLLRMSRQDAADLRTLEAAAEQARKQAERLLALQAERARAIDEARAELARARERLAASEAALEAYEARIAEEAEKAREDEAGSPSVPEEPPEETVPQASGSGPWETGTASHYGRSFTGTAASGVEIGPYSMIVAHRTLPFGTLVEFEYEGRRAVASVEDRGPHVPGRMWDLGPGVVRALDFSGVHEVRYRIVSQ